MSIADHDWAHAPPIEDASRKGPHLLDDHLRAVAALASAHAAPDVEALAGLAGLWHDLGKRRAGFQAYIRQVGGIDAHIEGRISDADKTHSAAGAMWARQALGQAGGKPGELLGSILQYVIAGHHAGLSDWGKLQDRLASDATAREFRESLGARAADTITHPDLPNEAGALQALRAMRVTQEHGTAQPGRFALHLRMLFSALVDADFLDTEAYFSPQLRQARAEVPELPALHRALQAHLAELAKNAPEGPVNSARAAVLRQCLGKAALAPGVFRLQVPTGGGKTLASMAFALAHAQAHAMRRVVVAIPFTSIIEQTAMVYRQAFGALGEGAVIEHHSNAETAPERETSLSRLACENWDAPVIVTTNVQLFESLFAARTSRCRKLHNLAGSVIVLDEAQTLPVGLLQPVVDVLRYLTEDFGVSVVLCTATQPALDAAKNPEAGLGLARGIGPVTDLIDDPASLYASLERVQVHLPASFDERSPWPELAQRMAAHPAMLAIVNRRGDAAELHQQMAARCLAAGEAAPWHLSALMCPKHRSHTLGAIRAALQRRQAALARFEPAEPVRVVSTQLVEAGVDLDFPVVFRAMAGMDSVFQAAGRCNREGRLSGLGQVFVFVPPTDPPQGFLRQAYQTARRLWASQREQPFALPLVDAYFRGLYADAPSTDAHGICGLLSLQVDSKALTAPLALRQAADAFRMIDNDEAVPVVVRYADAEAGTGGEGVASLLGLLQRHGPSRWLMRKLQPFTVAVFRKQAEALLGQGDIEEVPGCPGLFAQRPGAFQAYDPLLGLRVLNAPQGAAVFDD